MLFNRVLWVRSVRLLNLYRPLALSFDSARISWLLQRLYCDWLRFLGEGGLLDLELLLQLLDHSLLAVAGGLDGSCTGLYLRGYRSGRLLDGLQSDGWVFLLLEKLRVLLRWRELATAERDSRRHGVLHWLLNPHLPICALSYKWHLWLGGLSLLGRLLLRHCRITRRLYCLDLLGHLHRRLLKILLICLKRHLYWDQEK